MGETKGGAPLALLAIAALVALVLWWNFRYAEERPRFVAVVSSRCPHCTRATGDMEASGTRGLFTLVDVDELGDDDDMQRRLIGIGYAGAVPFFANLESGRSVVGYLPHRDVLAALDA
jgi:hypothetical protein